MADGGEELVSPREKIRKIEPKLRTLADKTKISSELHADILKGLRFMYDSAYYALCPLELTNTNGAEGYGVSFSNAFCSTEVKKPIYPIGSFFNNGMRVLHSFLQKPNEALQDHEMEMCSKLTTFLSDKDSMNMLQNIVDGYLPTLHSEVRISVALTEHLLKKLALKDTYIIDPKHKKIDENFECGCGCHHDIKNELRDTSLGSKKVWHGYVDVLLGCPGQEVPVLVSKNDEENVNPSGGSTPVGKARSLHERGVKDQLIAQAIVYSFLQKKRHPSARHFLIPTIGVCPKEIIFYLYDAELDILLQSKCLQFFAGGRISYGTIIAVWFVVNYEYLGSGLMGSLKKIPKSQFVSDSNKMIDVYRQELSFGNVGHSSGGSSEFHLDQILNSDFVFPEGVEQYNLD